LLTCVREKRYNSVHMTSDVREQVVRVIEEAGGLHSVADLAKRWGVSRARAHELTLSADFPDPLVYVGKSALYLGNEADAYRATVRPAGRPPTKRGPDR
jgi:hypothetical protein